MLLWDCSYVKVRETHTSESIVIRPPEVVDNMVEVCNNFASYTAHLKNSPDELGWHCLSRTFDT